MLQQGLEGEWSGFRFEEAVLTAFSFLSRDHAFQCVQTEVNRVEYRSSVVAVVVYHDPSSFELGAKVGLLASGGSHGSHEMFSVWEIARASGARDVDARTFFQASTPERVAKLIPQLAGVLARYGARALTGDVTFFRALRDGQQRESELFLASGRAAFLRQEVTRAWAERDYARVVELFEGMPGGLSPAEEKKLEYARMRANTSSGGT